MLRRNLATESGLVNGARGIVRKIDYTNDTVDTIHVSFHDKTVASKYRLNELDTVPIKRVTAEYFGLNDTILSRTQFPIILCYAVTLHKCQGLTLPIAVLDLGKDMFCTSMAYVAISRLRSLDTLAITELDPTSVGFRVPSQALPAPVQ